MVICLIRLPQIQYLLLRDVQIAPKKAIILNDIKKPNKNNNSIFPYDKHALDYSSTSFPFYNAFPVLLVNVTLHGLFCSPFTF